MTMTPAEYDAASWGGWVAAVRLLLDVGDVGPDGLSALIADVKRGRWADDDDRPLPPAVSVRRRLLLDELCRTLAAAHGADEWPFPGDLVALHVPDDLGSE
ncbi:hypothetical protein SAMN05660642_01343 [Geodermatophilus siccatus]|uniref:Uncharacterized protein n=1 Tax=Geodermatophilus siccatus TaxID=1137991 RepID=A0A1G9PSE2_9ACTN|nr:hypothetical protein [Geodermatophilus siccatus]SDM01686.1 hypothetical protein SAMN05660642_01343 [Geodermatophilus siccatus]